MHRTRFVGVVVAVVALSGVGVLFAPAASGGLVLPQPIHLAKVVEGPAPQNPTYVLFLDCDSGFSGPHTFHAAGTADPQVPLNETGPTSCTLTETEDGGAEEVTISCSNATDFAECDGNDTLVWTAKGVGSGTITVTNTFTERDDDDDDEKETTTTTTPAPVAPAPVVAAPRTTG